jgi:hypothetical protein
MQYKKGKIQHTILTYSGKHKEGAMTARRYLTKWHMSIYEKKVFHMRLKNGFPGNCTRVPYQMLHDHLQEKGFSYAFERWVSRDLFSLNLNFY